MFDNASQSVTYDFVKALFLGITKVFKVLPRPYKERSFIQICCKSTIHDLFCLFVFDNWVQQILAGVAVCKQVKNVGLGGIGSHFGHHEKRGISLNNGLLQGSCGLVAFRLL